MNPACVEENELATVRGDSYYRLWQLCPIQSVATTDLQCLILLFIQEKIPQLEFTTVTRLHVDIGAELQKEFFRGGAISRGIPFKDVLMGKGFRTDLEDADEPGKHFALFDLL